jgi:hypothetical protein
MNLALNMAKMAKEGFSHAAIEQTKYLIKNPCAKVRAEKKWGVEFPGHKKVKAAIERHPAMLRHNQTSSCLLCQNGAARIPQTRWRYKGTGAPSPTRRSVRTPEPTPPPACRAPGATGNTSVAPSSDIVNLPAGYTYSHTALLCAEFSEDNEDTKHDTDFDPDMLTDDG